MVYMGGAGRILSVHPLNLQKTGSDMDMLSPSPWADDPDPQVKFALPSSSHIHLC
jgi:hypothetical protein